MDRLQERSGRKKERKRDKIKGQGRRGADIEVRLGEVTCGPRTDCDCLFWSLVLAGYPNLNFAFDPP